MTSYDLHVTNEPSIPTTTPRTVIVQVTQGVTHMSDDLASPLTQKTRPWLDDGYRITHVDSCAVRGDLGLVLITVVLEKND